MKNKKFDNTLLYKKKIDGNLFANTFNLFEKWKEIFSIILTIYSKEINRNPFDNTYNLYDQINKKKLLNNIYNL